MRRHRLALALAALPCALLLLSMPLAAQQVYKWKDANGVTQYGATPPAKGSYEAREIDNRQAAEPATQAPAQPEDPGCSTARSNLALLGAKAPLRVDSDGDGKPDKTLTEEDRANQRALMEATIKVKCATATAPQDEPEES
jgi:hypothetical protein